MIKTRRAIERKFRKMIDAKREEILAEIAKEEAIKRDALKKEYDANIAKVEQKMKASVEIGVGTWTIPEKCIGWIPSMDKFIEYSV